LFAGIQLIVYDLDLVAIILWIIYGGVIIIFFVYSLMWVDFSKNEYYSNKFKLFYYGFVNFFIFFIFYFLNLEEGFEFKFLKFRYFDFYLLLNQSNLEELEGLG
jgi:NADH:ubiquinone oxidoreductase subunit 6 (subunit J)